MLLPISNTGGASLRPTICLRHVDIFETTANVIQDLEDFIDILVREGKYTEAVQSYISILNNPKFRSKDAKGPFQQWTEMLELLIDHARLIPNPVPLSNGSTMAVETIIRSGLQRFPDQRGILWVGLARYVSLSNLTHVEKPVPANTGLVH